MLEGQCQGISMASSLQVDSRTFNHLLFIEPALSKAPVVGMWDKLPLFPLWSKTVFPSINDSLMTVPGPFTVVSSLVSKSALWQWWVQTTVCLGF